MEANELCISTLPGCAVSSSLRPGCRACLMEVGLRQVWEKMGPRGM